MWSSVSKCIIAPRHTGNFNGKGLGFHKFYPSGKKHNKICTTERILSHVLFVHIWCECPTLSLVQIILIYQGVYCCTNVCYLRNCKDSDTTWELKMSADLYIHIVSRCTGIWRELNFGVVSCVCFVLIIMLLYSAVYMSRWLLHNRKRAELY